MMKCSSSLVLLAAFSFAGSCVSAASPISIGFFQGNGTSHVGHNDNFYAVLGVAATSAFGADGFTLQNHTDAEVKSITRASHDVMVFPGGSGGGQAKAIGEDGMAAMRKFVSEGGGYIGTCGGAFLGLQHIQFYGPGPSGHGPPTQEPWDRGHGNVSVEFTAGGLSAMNLGTDFDGNVTIKYWQGPIVKAADLPANVSQWAFFRTEIHSQHPNETTGEMVNTPAFSAVDYGQGRVVLNSPHPELGPQHPQIYTGELKWVLRE
jgi:hypothetical protein